MMSYAPLFIALGILALATILYYMLPAIIDQEKSMLWIALAFLVTIVNSK